MKPPAFNYVAPTTLEEALDARAEHADDCAVLAGGQSLMPLLNLRMAFPGTVIDLAGVGELAGIREWDGGVAIGAMTRQRTAEGDALIRERAPLMTTALPNIGHAAIRNRGTVGGSIAHADPAAELPAVALALDAQLVAKKKRGERTIEAADFFAGFLTTALEPDELLVEVRVPGMAKGHGVAFHELARRHGDFALVGVAAAVALEGDKIADCRLAFIGVGGTPMRAREAEKMLVGAQPSAEVFAEAAERAKAELDPAGDTHASAEYRRRVAGVLAQRALAEATR
ncbi:MAG TPA: xanthine dehydrogenase family protein subunit M [Solirubrobacteraceae bacterium]|nr:xanthine dehydrogenase family protein subunit M [Solirubrobacteraceae bacterium]